VHPTRTHPTDHKEAAVQYELRTQVIEPQRRTFDHLVERHGDRPASRYEEGTFDIQARENFHYRPLWDPSREIYDESFSALRLTDPYSFTDPRQFYYAPYVTSRAAMSDAFSATLGYLESRGLLERLPDAWRELVAQLVVPLRHYESGAQLVWTAAARFGFGTSITQCAAYAAFDRVGNAQMLSRVGIALGGGTASLLEDAKVSWLEDDALQPLRMLVEETIIEQDWALSLIALDVADQLLYRVLFAHLDAAAVTGGAPAYSLTAQHLADWFKDHRRWLDALYRSWTVDPELGAANATMLADAVGRAVDNAVEALRPLCAKADTFVGAGCVRALEEVAAEVRAEHTTVDAVAKGA
jgi:phenol hydroxylase P1 protein